MSFCGKIPSKLAREKDEDDSFVITIQGDEDKRSTKAGEGVSEKELHSAIISLQKRYIMQGTVHLIIGERKTSYGITNMSVRPVCMVYKCCEGNIVFYL